MLEKEKKEILEWIFNCHHHHEDGSDCYYNAFPYVNSIELEKFINSFEVNEIDKNKEKI